MFSIPSNFFLGGKLVLQRGVSIGREIAQGIFPILLSLALVLQVIERLVPGSVSLFTNPTSFLWLAVVTGAVEKFESQSAASKDRSSRRLMIIATLFLACLTYGSFFRSSQVLGIVAFFSIITFGLVIFLVEHSHENK